MPNMNDPAELTFYYTAPLFLPCTIEDPNFLGVYSSTSTLPTTANNFNTAGVAGTGAMYVYLNNSWQFVGQYLHDAYRYLVYYQGSSFASASGTKWSSIFNDIASNSSLMTEFSANSASASNLSASSIAMNAIVASSTAMSAVAGSSTAMNVITNSYTAMSAIAGSSTAMQAVGNSTTAMSAILSSSTYKETWWGSSYYVGLGLNTYAGLNDSTLAGLNTVSAIANSNEMNTIAASSTAMTAIAASSTAMNAMVGNLFALSSLVASSIAMTAIAASSTAMNIVAGSTYAMEEITNSYTAMNAMTTLVAKNAFQSASAELSSIQTLVSNINSGKIALGGGATGSSSALGWNALLVLLSYDNGAAVPAGNATSSPTPTLASKMYSAYSPTQNSYAGNSSSAAVVVIATNQIVFAIGAYTTTSGNAAGLGNASGYQVNGTGASNIIYTTSTSLTYPNEGISPLLLSGTLYVEGEITTYYYFLSSSLS